MDRYLNNQDDSWSAIRMGGALAWTVRTTEGQQRYRAFLDAYLWPIIQPRPDDIARFLLDWEAHWNASRVASNGNERSEYALAIVLVVNRVVCF